LTPNISQFSKQDLERLSPKNTEMAERERVLGVRELGFEVETCVFGILTLGTRVEEQQFRAEK